MASIGQRSLLVAIITITILASVFAIPSLETESSGQKQKSESVNQTKVKPKRTLIKNARGNGIIEPVRPTLPPVVPKGRSSKLQATPEPATVFPLFPINDFTTLEPLESPPPPPPTPPPRICVDQHVICEFFRIKNLCVLNAPLMNSYCPASCGLCHHSTCLDVDIDCLQFLNMGECDANPPYMWAYCPQACDQCLY